MLPSELYNHLSDSLNKVYNQEVNILKIIPLGGGSINNAYKLDTSIGYLFLKWNDKDKYPGMFESEAKGLRLLSENSKILIPDVILINKTINYTYLILEFIEAIPQKQDFWEDFGEKLAQMHQVKNASFGLDHDNYIGSLPQSNKQRKNWADFFFHERLEIMVRMARNKGLINTSHVGSFEKLFKIIPEIFPIEPASLIHGDLWNGNYIIGNNGYACLIDPAVYYGHREMDLGMSKLFGGFSSQFYEAYNTAFPLEKGWEKRLDICNLYPLMVHVNLFGTSYLGGVIDIIRSTL